MSAPCQQLLCCAGPGRGSHLLSLLPQMGLRIQVQAEGRCAPQAPIPACLVRA